jgi:hypothetical protein
MPDYFGAGTGFALTMRLFDFGADVAIAVPPAAEVADLTDRLPS